MSTTIAKANPKVGFVSLGCPKALVDSERILTQLRMEGYDVVSTYQDADVVVVNTCGFIDSAKAESLEVIGEAIKENGKVIVTGCMGVEEGNIRNVHPSVLAVTGPQQYEQVVNAVHQVVPPRQDHNPLIDLVPPQLRVPEDFRRLQPQLQLLHHPVDARQAGQPPGGRCAGRSPAPGQIRR
jgi:ribosomal protein S12 methylthiotransferase